MKPIPLLLPNLPTPTKTFNNKPPIAQWYVCPHCNIQSPLVKEWVGLTDEELIALSESGLALWELWKAIEAKLRSKNT